MEMARRGRIEVICGSMFSGKTEELIRRLKRAKFARQKVEIFKPALDTRYSQEEVVSHDSNHILSTPIESSASILLLATDVDVVGIDEAQFFDDELPAVCNELVRRGTRVIIPGWIWILSASLLVLCLLLWHLPTKLPRYTPSACAAVILPMYRIVQSRTTNWCFLEKKWSMNLYAASVITKRWHREII